jgi:hypothetical protein
VAVRRPRMVMTPRLRRFALTAHVVSSVGWLGAVVVFLALAVIGLTSGQPQTVRGTYLVKCRAIAAVARPRKRTSMLRALTLTLRRRSSTALPSRRRYDAAIAT